MRLYEFTNNKIILDLKKISENIKKRNLKYKNLLKEIKNRKNEPKSHS